MHPNFRHINSPIIAGHRGYRAKYPENTLASFSAAIVAGADMIELDVTFSKDRQVVVIHDDTLDRTTNGFGPVGRATLLELKRLDAGSWFDSRFAGEALPTLEEVLLLVGKKTLINVEIKSGAWEPGAAKEAIERQVVELILRHDLLDTVLVSSFHIGLLENIKKLPVHPRIALITDRKAPGNPLETCRQLGVFSWHPHFKYLAPWHIEKAHAQGIRIFPYTVNTIQEMKSLVIMGVDGIITDDPAAAAIHLATNRRR